MKKKLQDIENQELKEGIERQRMYAEEKVREAEESNRQDLLILDYFDTKPSLEPLDNIYQIPIIYPTPQPLGFIGQIAGAVYLRLCENNEVNINVKGSNVNVKVDLRYINGFLNHQYNYCNGVKSDFLNHLFNCIAFGRTVFGESKEYTSNKSFVDSWVNNKLIFDTQPKRIKVNSTEIDKSEIKGKGMSRRSCALAYYYIANRENHYEPLTKKNSLEICEIMGFKFNSVGVANDCYKIGNRANRTQNSGNTKSNNSLIKDFGLCINYLNENHYLNAKSVAETELNILLNNTK